MHRGYIKLWRKLRDNPMWLSEPFTHGQALVDLFMLANHKQSIVMIRGISVTIEPGQVVAGEQYLGDRWRWSRGKVRRFLRNLAQQNDAPIDLQTNNVISVVAITNWELYQASDTTDDTANSTTDGQQKNNRRTTDGHTEECTSTTRRKEGAKRFVPPTVEEVAAYIKEKGFTISAQRFIDGNQQKGWKVGKSTMVDWKAAVRTWQANEDSGIFKKQSPTTPESNGIFKVVLPDEGAGQ